MRQEDVLSLRWSEARSRGVPYLSSFKAQLSGLVEGKMCLVLNLSAN
jgi:hypothetical protein